MDRLRHAAVHAIDVFSICQNIVKERLEEKLDNFIIEAMYTLFDFWLTNIDNLSKELITVNHNVRIKSVKRKEIINNLFPMLTILKPRDKVMHSEMLTTALGFLPFFLVELKFFLAELNKVFQNTEILDEKFWQNLKLELYNSFVNSTSCSENELSIRIQLDSYIQLIGEACGNLYEYTDAIEEVNQYIYELKFFNEKSYKKIMLTTNFPDNPENFTIYLIKEGERFFTAKIFRDKIWNTKIIIFEDFKKITNIDPENVTDISDSICINSLVSFFGYSLDIEKTKTGTILVYLNKDKLMFFNGSSKQTKELSKDDFQSPKDYFYIKENFNRLVVDQKVQEIFSQIKLFKVYSFLNAPLLTKIDANHYVNLQRFIEDWRDYRNLRTHYHGYNINLMIDLLKKLLDKYDILIEELKIFTNKWNDDIYEKIKNVENLKDIFAPVPEKNLINSQFSKNCTIL